MTTRPNKHKRDLAYAWAAGIIDGEGCISIKMREHKYYALSVVVGQSGPTEPRMLRRLRQIFGAGNIGRQGTDLRRAQKWHWEVVCGSAEMVLRLVEPYLIQKRDQARVGLRHRKATVHPGGRTTLQQKMTSLHCYHLLRGMKRYRKTHDKWREKDE